MTKKQKTQYNDLTVIRVVEKAMSQGRDLEPVLEEIFNGMETPAEAKLRLAKKPKTKRWRQS